MKSDPASCIGVSVSETAISMLGEVLESSLGLERKQKLTINGRKYRKRAREAIECCVS